MNYKRLLLPAVVGASTLAVTIWPAPAAPTKNTTATKTQKSAQLQNKQSHRKERMERMARELNLTNAQKTKFKTIHEESRRRMKAIRADKSLSEDQKRTKMREIRRQSRERQTAILTAEQKRKLAAWRSQHKSQRPHRDGQKPKKRDGQKTL